ncbi:MAG: hypothetical protein ACK42C_07015, partial [Aquificaceae bacterium]
ENNRYIDPFWDDIKRFMASLVKAEYSGYDPGIFLRALAFFEDAEKENNRYIDPFWDDIKRFMASLVKAEYRLSMRRPGP